MSDCAPSHCPNVNYKRLNQLANEFTELWKRIQSLYLDAAAGFALVRSTVERDQAKIRELLRGTEFDSEAFQDTTSFTYKKVFAGDFCTSGIHQAKQGEVKARNAPDGDNFVLLGQLCIVSFYDFWNDYLRREYVIAKGVLDESADHEAAQAAMRTHASHDLWGDIRLLRQSIVHNRGRAVSEITSCKLIQWFKPGDLICLTPEHMRVLLVALLVYHNELFAEQFPPHYITIPDFKKKPTEG